MGNDYDVLIRVDGDGRIVEINSSAFVADMEGWIVIDRGTGVRYAHAQGNYLPLPIVDLPGVYRYAYVPDAAEGEPKWRERTQAEMDADRAARAAVAQSDPLCDLAELVVDNTLQIEMLNLMVEGGAGDAV